MYVGVQIEFPRNSAQGMLGDLLEVAVRVDRQSFAFASIAMEAAKEAKVPWLDCGRIMSLANGRRVGAMIIKVLGWQIILERKTYANCIVSRRTRTTSVDETAFTTHILRHWPLVVLLLCR